VGDLISMRLIKQKYALKDYYFQVLMMGLRLAEGIDLSISKYKEAYLYYRDKLKYTRIENNHLICNNLNVIDNTLLELI
jgi:oxygen-independent coproporphyrinogen-3 oxidase